ncbi:hypothetical protein N0B31_05305 [Salinirubellus salinus]|uniref:Uncharacterized protein n=1 Tax=Salinirubellus salinus TaxID=1364945 RepID=A0A9E7R514_9EURY|nr:hypothetical protein [Salinirubellus salinus]UWM55702.1 hypothetical protein N0B31_05305 [Salinirubellus salinus]
MSSRDRSDPDLATLVEELRDTLDELQVTVERDRGGPPAPAGPRELLRFTESYTIPTLISVLEASIRALELLRATLRLVDGRPIDSTRRETTSDAARRVESAGRATLDRVDAALSELTTALEGEPPAGEARDLLAEARSLRDEVDARLRTGAPDESAARRRAETDRRDRHDRRRTDRADRDGAHEIPVRAESEPTPEAEDVDPPTTDDGPAVDVDAELESIREAVADERERSAAWRPGGESAERDDGAGEDDSED